MKYISLYVECISGIHIYVKYIFIYVDYIYVEFME